MRKILLLILCCFTMCVIAQETKHLEFKGVPMEGNVFSFADKLVEKGFKWEEPLEGYIFMTGRFMEREVGVLIMGTFKTNTIWKIVVITDEEFTTWYRLKSKYTEYTRLFTKKYGMPTAHLNSFLHLITKVTAMNYKDFGRIKVIMHHFMKTAKEQ